MTGLIWFIVTMFLVPIVILFIVLAFVAIDNFILAPRRTRKHKEWEKHCKEEGDRWGEIQQARVDELEREKFNEQNNREYEEAMRATALMEELEERINEHKRMESGTEKTR